MAKELEKKLLEELSRFNQITHNTDNLNEQMVSGVGNLGMGSHVERLAKRVGMEIGEQDAPEVEDEAPEMGVEDEEVVDTETEGGEEGMDVGIEDTEEIGGEESGDTTELEVTDLVTKQDETNTELSDQKDILAKNTESLEDLMSKLSDLETHLTSMDDMVNKISNLEDKLEEYRPRTPEEKISLRKYDSGPFNKTLTDFFSDKEEEFDKTGKKQYILTPDEVIDYNESDVKKSFDPDSEEE